MALIPSESKANRFGNDGFNLEIVMFIFLIVMLGQNIFEEKVHPYLSWVLLVLVGGISLYLILPSSKNHGKQGYSYILNYLKYLRMKMETRRLLKK